MNNITKMIWMREEITNYIANKNFDYIFISQSQSRVDSTRSLQYKIEAKVAKFWSILLD